MISVDALELPWAVAEVQACWEAGEGSEGRWEVTSMDALELPKAMVEIQARSGGGLTREKGLGGGGVWKTMRVNFLELLELPARTKEMGRPTSVLRVLQPPPMRTLAAAAAAVLSPSLRHTLTPTTPSTVIIL
jgi:hypothetical protein